MKMKWNLKTDHLIFFILMVIVIVFRIKAMFPFQLDWYRDKQIAIPSIIIAIMIRKIIQNLTAHRFGDMELKINSQKIWNPLFMIDWIGFIPFVFLNFGWAKPIDSHKAIAGNKKWARIQIISSGMIANLVVAILFKWLHHSAELVSLNLAAYMNQFALINMNYFLFTLLPIPPLDGWLLFKVTKTQKVKLASDEIYGYSLLFVLFLINFPQIVLLPISQFLLQWF
jgi:Zn-dependent protease